MALLSRSAPAQVFVEDSPAAAELMLAAEDRLTKGEPEDAAKSIQKLLDEHGSKLLELEPGRYSEVRRVVAHRLLDRPELLTAYRALYQPQAAQLLDHAGHDRKALTEVFRRYGLTDAGLEASLRLVGLELESGEADGALVVLTQLKDHPSIDSHRDLWLQLKAVAALLLNQREEFNQTRSELAGRNSNAIVADLDRLSSGLTAEAIRLTVLSPLDLLPPARLPDVPQPLWTIPIEGTEVFIKSKYQPEAAHLADQFDRGRYLNAIPFIAGDRLLVNDGQGVTAIEPASGRLLWRQRIAEDDVIAGNNFRYNNVQPGGFDMNCLAASPQNIVAICGFGAMSMQFPFVESPSSTWLACLDARTGKTLWSKKPEEVAEDLGESFWYGRPIISEGRVYVTARRRQRTQFNDAYVMALDIASGDLLWRRHLAAIAIVSRQVVPAYVHMALDHGWLYVDTRLGTIARLSALDGAVDWLTILDGPARPQGEISGRAFEATEPILTKAGLIILDAMSQSVRVIDPETGLTLDKFSAMDWNWPAYLAPLPDGDLLAVGQQIHRISGQSPKKKLWTYDTRGEDLRGRVTITQDTAYLPTATGLLPITIATGQPGKPLPIDTPANALVRDGQVIAVHRDGIRGYSTWSAASQQLHERIARQPDDPRPHIDLAWLALRTDHPQALVESLDSAAKALSDARLGDEARKMIFDSILDMTTQEKIKADVRLRQDVFDRVALIAAGPEQEVAYRFALAQFYDEQHRPAEAVEQYQLILANPVFRAQAFKDQRRSCPASLEAYERLNALIKTHGRAIYEPYDTIAAKQLQALSREVDPDGLVELIESHPLALIVPQALTLAAARHAELDHPAQAIALLRRVPWESLKDDQAINLFTREVQLLEKLGEPARARRVLRFMIAAYPKAAISPDPAGWLRTLDAATSGASATGRLDVPLSAPAAIFPATLMRPTSQDTLATDPQGLLLRWPDRIEFRRLRDLSVAWTRPASQSEIQLLSIDTRRTWLWHPRDNRLEVINTETGQLDWELRDLAKRMAAIDLPPAALEFERPPQPPAPPPRRLMGRQLREGQRLPGNPLLRELREPPRPKLMFALNDIALAAADAQGRVIVLDVSTGQTLWQAATEVKRTTHLLLDERHLILSGSSGLAEEAAPLVTIFDAQSGMRRDSLLQDSDLQVPEWLAISDDARLIMVSRHRVQTFDLTRGQIASIKPGIPLDAQAGAWLDGDRLLVQSREGEDENNRSITGGDMIWIDLAHGQVVHRESVRGKLEPPVQVIPDPRGRGRWILFDNDRCIAVGPDGVPKWTDSITTPGRFIDIAVSDQLVAILSIPTDAQLLKSHDRRIFLLDRETGAIRHEPPFDSPAPLDQIDFTASRLLLTGEGITVIFGNNSN